MRMGKRVLLIALISLCAPALAYDWSTNPGDGSPENPYQISEPNHLFAIGSNAALLDKHFILMNDIIFDPNNNPAHVFNNALIAPDQDNTTSTFTGTTFTGHFDGQNYTIHNFTCFAPGGYYIGLFGYVQAGVIENLSLEDVLVSGKEHVGGFVGFSYGVLVNIRCSGTVSGMEEVGGIVGTSFNGFIKDCVSNVSVSLTSWEGGGICGYVCDTPIINCRATGDISGDGEIGGLIGGSRWSYIINCSASGSVTGDERIGGLIGWLDWYLVKSCFATGNVQANSYAGGLVGENLGIIENSYASGDVYAPTGAGGLIGADWSGDGHILNCLATGIVTGITKTGGLIGNKNSSTLYLGKSFFDATKNPGLPAIGDAADPNIVGKSTLELCDLQTFISCGWDFVDEASNGTEDLWTAPQTECYPALMFQTVPEPDLPEFSGGDGSVNDPFLIASTAQFNSIGSNLHLMGKHFKLITDLDFADLAFNPIGSYDMPFFGTFDGNKKRIRNVYPAAGEQDYIGVFNSLENGAKVFDLGVENFTACSGGTVGGIAGEGYGVIIERSYVTASLSGASEGGLIIGEMSYGEIKNCYAHGYAATNGRIGGIAADLLNTIVSNSYVSLRVGTAGDAGIIYAYGTADLRACFYDAANNSLVKAKGLMPLTGAYGCSQSELSDPNVFITKGWDFFDEQQNGTNDIWRCSRTGPAFVWHRDFNVPDVVGLQITDAQVALSQWQFNIVAQKNVYSETAPVGAVLDQCPLAGSACIASVPVALLISKGPCPYSKKGSGTPDNPCQIATVADLNLLANTADDYALHFILVNNLNLGQAVYNGGIFNEHGKTLPTFTGVFDGNGHTISNFRINILPDWQMSHGLFRNVGLQGQIKNLTVSNLAFSGVNYRILSGGIVGEMGLGLIENCRFSGTISSVGSDFGGIINYSKGIIRDCLVEITATGTYRLAGLALGNAGIISACHATVNLTAGSDVAGLVDSNSGFIENSYARGTLKGKWLGGGLVAYNMVNNKIKNCYAACTLTGTFYSNSAGGLIGSEGNTVLTYPGCVWDRTLYTGNGTGRNSPSVLGATTAQMKQIGTFTARGWDFLGENINGESEIWRMCADGVDYPRLSWEFSRDGDFACGDGVDLADLLALAEHWLMTEAGNPSAFNYAADANSDRQINLEDLAVLSSNWP